MKYLVLKFIFFDGSTTEFFDSETVALSLKHFVERKPPLYEEYACLVTVSKDYIEKNCEYSIDYRWQKKCYRKTIYNTCVYEINYRLKRSVSNLTIAVVKFFPH